MKKSLFGIILFAFIAGCHHTSIVLPQLDEHQVLVTHIKVPVLAVIDIDKNEIVHKQQFNFLIQSVLKIDNQQLVLAGKHEKEVKLLDLSSNKSRTLIHSVSSIADLLYDTESQMLFAADALRNEVIFFDMAQDAVTTRVNVGAYPTALALQDEVLYVLNEGDASVTLIHVPTRKIMNTFKVVERPTDLVVKQDNIYVGGHGASIELNEFVHVYDKSSGALVEKIKVGLMPVALYSDRHSEDIWVLSHGSNELHTIDPQSFTVSHELTMGENPYYITGDSHYIYVTALDGDKLTVIDRQKYMISQELTLFAGPYGIVSGGSNDE